MGKCTDDVLCKAWTHDGSKTCYLRRNNNGGYTLKHHVYGMTSGLKVFHGRRRTESPTASPSDSPTTWSPSQSPTTESPTASPSDSPTTLSPSQSPTTEAPTASPS